MTGHQNARLHAQLVACAVQQLVRGISETAGGMCCAGDGEKHQRRWLVAHREGGMLQGACNCYSAPCWPFMPILLCLQAHP